MRKEDVKIGMKVRPFQKTAKGWEEDINEYKKHTYNPGKFFGEKEYLFVIKYDTYEEAWILSEDPEENDGDFFNSEDFKPYSEEKENGFEIKCKDCGYIGCDLNVVYCGFQFSCPNCGQIYKQ